MKLLNGLAALVAGMSFSVGALTYAADFPEKPVRFVVPFPPGGGTDALARILGGKLAEYWGQQVIVENNPGANNQLAAEYVAKSPNDGTVLFIGPEVTFTVNPSLYPKLGYDPV